MQTSLLLCFFLFFLNFPFYAQNNLLIKVIDGQNNQELVYANIYLKNNQLGSSSNLDGKAIFKLDAINDLILVDTLVCSYVGYRDTSIIINLQNSKSLIIPLQTNIVALDEVVVSSESIDLDSKKILKKSLKAVKNNYSQQATILEGFYRELLKEEERYIQLNEAFFELFYTPYPQKRYTRKGWNSYYPTYQSADYYPSDKYVIFRNAQFLKYWNTVEDQCKVIKARSSEDWSKDGVEIVAENGPLDLSAIDKVKYQADFLDPKLVNKYDYSKLGATYINEEPCYIIAFKAKKLKLTQSQDLGKKVKIPIFSGKLYISMNDFAITRFECQLTEGALPDSRYRRNMPTAISLSCDYLNRKGKWYLNKVTAEQTLTSYTSSRIKYAKELKRELWVQNVRTEAVKPFKKNFETTFTDRRKGNLRYFPVNYDSVFWKNPDKYKPLPKLVEKDLSAKGALEQQFKDRFFQKNLAPLIYPSIKDTVFVHHDTIIDDYTWLNQLNDTLVQEVIKSENKYFKNYFIPYKSHFSKAHFDITYNTQNCEHDKVEQTKAFYIGFSDLGKYGLIFNKKNSKTLMVDYDHLCPNCRISYFATNKDTSLLAYTVKSKEHNATYVKSITLDTIVTQLKNIHEMRWLKDDLILYTKQDATYKTYLVGTYTISEGKEKLLKETDTNTKELEYIYTSKNKNYYFFTENHEDFNQLLAINQHGQISPLYPHDEKSYTLKLDEDESYWYALIRNNDWSSSIIRAKKSENKKWETYVSYNNEEAIDDFKVTSNYLAVHSIKNAIPYLYIHAKEEMNKREQLKFPSKFHTLNFNNSSSLIGGDSILLSYSSLNELDGTYTLDLKNKRLHYKKEKCYNKFTVKEIPSYETKILEVPTKEAGNFIPLHISQNIDPNITKKGVILGVYGAYGAFNSSSYNDLEALLMDKGYILAQAHVRGSRAKGWPWYESGKLYNKLNGIEDYITCAEYIVNNKILPTQRVVAYGQSAGGLIVGAAINKAPQLFKVAILDYPYLDVLNTMLDDSLPLTSLEYQEWGNPQEKKAYEYIKAYSPYQNIKAQKYPAIILFAGSKDFQTPYWQVLSSVAKYRKLGNKEQTTLIHIGDNEHLGQYPYGQRVKEIIYQYIFMENNIDN